MSKFQRGSLVVFTTTEPGLLARSGKRATVVRQLTEDEADGEVQPMYRVRFNDRTEIDAFEEELRLCPR